MRSDATTPKEYLAALAPERRKVVGTVRRVIRANLPTGYREEMGFGMLTYVVPRSRYPDTYNGQPLQYVALAAQKNHFSIYLMCLYDDQDGPAERDFRRRWTATGRQLDMGRSCIRFKRLDDLDLDLIAEAVASTPIDEYLAQYEATRAGRAR